MELKPKQIPQHQLTLTPGLRLSLDILQMPLLKLQEYLSQQLEENPILEQEEEYGTEQTSESTTEPEETKPDPFDQVDDGYQNLWQESSGSSEAEEENDRPQSNPQAKPPSLHEHLKIQLRYLCSDEEIIGVSEKILDWLDTSGYLRNTLEEVIQTEGIKPELALKALSLIQSCDPSGIGARDLAECLLIQLRQKHRTNSLAARIVSECFDCFTKRQYRQIASRLGASLSQVQEACHLISQLEPKPARNFSVEPTAYAVADLIVKEQEGSYEVELNDGDLPRINLSRRYRLLLKNPSTPADTKQFIRDKMRQAIWLLKAIGQRQATLLAIGKALIDIEREYFANGITHLKTIKQEDVAKLIGCHPSTISRAIAGKMIQTPYAMLSLESFFGGGVADATDASSKVSSKTIQAELEQLVASEDPSKPLSDEELLHALKSHGFVLARRTVAKYRAQIKILPAHLRKRTL